MLARRARARLHDRSTPRRRGHRRFDLRIQPVPDLAGTASPDARRVVDADCTPGASSVHTSQTTTMVAAVRRGVAAAVAVEWLLPVVLSGSDRVLDWLVRS